ncbi:MAG: hypothetical protein EAZ30_05175 [Betaproteobacteria bacterium]|nr:MAG: hypothetical protein EAZ30_05175 [Betaproteobacteria bacterium]
MNYTHLTQDERYPIAVLRKAGHTQGRISKAARRPVFKYFGPTSSAGSAVRTAASAGDRVGGTSFNK